MSVLDREVLKQLSLLQSELARYLRSTRQAISVGVKQDDDYLDSNRLLRLYDALRAGGDRRVVMVADMLKERYGIEADPSAVASTINGSPDSFPQGFKEIWVFVGEPFELTVLKHISLMRQHFGSSEKTIIYFVCNRSVGDRLARGITLETESLKRSGQETARVCVILCNAVMFMPQFMIFNPISKEAKGYVRVQGGYFAEMDCKQTGILVANFTTAGVRAIENEVLSSNSGFDGISFEITHQL